MLAKIKAFLQGEDAAPTGGADGDPVAAAAAAILVETALLDGTFGDDERTAIVDALGDGFDLTTSEADDLIGAALADEAHANGVYAATRVIRDGLDEAGRIAVVEMLWRVAYADGELHDYEANLVRRADGLLYVRDQDSGRARQRARDAMETRTVG